MAITAYESSPGFADADILVIVYVLGIILARAGSKGLPGKCVRPLLGRPMMAYTFDHAQASQRLSAIVVSTDSEPAKDLAKSAGLEVIDRPAELADDQATVDSAARHAVTAWEAIHHQRIDAVALLYANIPLRGDKLIDRAIQRLVDTGADSVRSVVAVSKQHPDWLHKLDGDRLTQFRSNSIYRRQDLEPLYYHDGAAVIVTRESLFAALGDPDNHQAFWGSDRRAIIQQAQDAVDVDDANDLILAESLLRSQQNSLNPSTHAIDMAHHTISPNEKAFVIAEIGVNHDGQLGQAIMLIDEAVQAGADAVKFQVFKAATLVTPDASTAIYQQDSLGVQSQHDMLAKLELTREDFRHLKAYCDRKEIVFLATPFSEDDLTFLIEMNVPAIKLASTDFTNRPLLEAAIQVNIPLILSTGACIAEEIDETIAHLKTRGVLDRSIIMHCVSCYPTPMHAINLRGIRTLQQKYDCLVGLSDHTTSLDTGALARAVGAVVIEKHMTFDCDATGPDHATSLNPDDFGQYITRLREAELALGLGQLGMSEIEADVRSMARKSIVASRSIPAGHVLSRADLVLKRPGTGIAPQFLEKLIGCKARIDIAPDTLLAGEMLE